MPLHVLQQEQPTVLRKLRRDGEIIITNNGKPSFLLVDLSKKKSFKKTKRIQPKHSKRKKPLINRSHQQMLAMKQFIATIKAIDDEPITEEDFIALETNRVKIDREINL